MSQPSKDWKLDIGIRFNREFIRGISMLDKDDQKSVGRVVAPSRSDEQACSTSTSARSLAAGHSGSEHDGQAAPRLI
jgi:hypothetical protein